MFAVFKICPDVTQIGSSSSYTYFCLDQVYLLDQCASNQFAFGITQLERLLLLLARRPLATIPNSFEKSMKVMPGQLSLCPLTGVRNWTKITGWLAVCY